MIKYFIITLLFASCSKKSSTTVTVSNQDLVVNKTWKAYDYKRNGTTDAVVIGQQPTFQFRNDGKVYFSQINPVYKDTLNFSFIDQSNIRLTRPAVSTTYYINFKIDRVTEFDFDFTATNNQTTSIDTYKTTKQ